MGRGLVPPPVVVAAAVVTTTVTTVVTTPTVVVAAAIVAAAIEAVAAEAVAAEAVAIEAVAAEAVITPVVVVASAVKPVEAPKWIPELPGAPVVAGCGHGRDGGCVGGDGEANSASGDCCRCCDTYQNLHSQKKTTCVSRTTGVLAVSLLKMCGR